MIAVDPGFYFETLYPFQDRVLQVIIDLDIGLIDREEPKDLADIWGFCCQMELSLLDAITGAQGKAAGIFPVDLARLLLSATSADWEAVRWIAPPPVAQLLSDLQYLGEMLILL